MVHLRKTGHGFDSLWARLQPHEGNPRRVLREMLGKVDGLEKMRLAATGRKFRHHLALSTISEPEAVERAVSHILPEDHPYRVVISAGGETFMVYHLDEHNRIQGIYTGNKCASGTGEFFLQQLGRMALPLEEIGGMEMPDQFHKVSGRCSVFCKSDCTHALNKGIPKAEVVAGLSRMLAGKAIELLKKLPKSNVMLIGGCSKNHAMVHYLREEIEDLYIPESAAWFEALGAALWALDSQVNPFTGIDNVFSSGGSSLSFLNPLSSAEHLVQYKEHPRGHAESGDAAIVGLDVGSTTTKGVVMRRSDKAILAAEYLRTNGDPVGASRNVYESLARQMDVPIKIEGLGVTGSGRQIAGLHAMTQGVINEIIAHATAAVHFDPEVDTIFEIGGQDAKYTYITNGVASDYAMNEACSAGTGSFLEESAKESLGLDVTQIGDTAFAGQSPPNFNDQCAAFIGSDIKRAAQEGVSVPDIVAGLVYSICMNYTNRVKGNRPVGKKVFMQGGVCYNKAIPAAMAALTGKEIIVPPDPGLMGAFGVALEVERRMEQGLIESGDYDLRELAGRDVTYLQPFRCAGGSEKCDLGCMISRIEIKDKMFFFGGICSRYENQLRNKNIDMGGYNLVAQREQRAFRDRAPEDPADLRPTVGLNRSFLMHTYFPFFNRFLAELGFRAVLPDQADPKGVDQQGAAFCYPVELSHAYAANLLSKHPDFLLLPHLRGLHSPGEDDATACTCVFVQSEPFYLPAAFPEFAEKNVLRPYLDFSKGIDTNLDALRQLAAQLQADGARAEAAAKAAWAEQQAFWSDLQDMGREALNEISHNDDEIGVVLFGRPYNSFAPEANKGVPPKFASRGVRIIPFDMLPYTDEVLPDERNMYWGMGRQILRAAQYVEKNPKLFGTYITNFSCGPDSFLVGYFRDIMGRKPSLTLELDSHTADAGIETRIEAFLDIVHFYRQVEKRSSVAVESEPFRQAEVEFVNGKSGIRTSSGDWVALTDPRVKVIMPALGVLGTPLLAKSFASVGIHAVPLPPADEEALKLGRGNSSCKECLPLQTTIGTMLQYIKTRPDGEITAYFMASTEGPCRFGQYHVFSKDLIDKHRFEDVAVLSLTSANGYAGCGDKFALAAWRAIIIGDLFDEMYSTILAAAVDRQQAVAVLMNEHNDMLEVIHKGWSVISRQLKRAARRLSGIQLKKPYAQIPKLTLTGEIYVRRDPISLQGLLERLAEHGFAVRTSQTSEWIKYLDWLAKENIEGENDYRFWIRYWVKRYFDRRVRKKLAPAGLFLFEDAEVEPIVKAGARHVSPNLTGEAILTVGSALHEILHPSCGIISIGPFGCMPTRVAESILSEKLTTEEKRVIAGQNGHASWNELLEVNRKLPYLAIETDGNAFPQVIEARLEAFMLQAKRIHESLMKEGHG